MTGSGTGVGSGTGAEQEAGARTAGFSGSVKGGLDGAVGSAFAIFVGRRSLVAYRGNKR